MHAVTAGADLLWDAAGGVPGRLAAAGMAGWLQRFLLGIELDRPAGVLLGRCAEAGLMISVTADRVIRLVPALILSSEEAAQVVSLLVPVIKQFLSEPQA